MYLVGDGLKPKCCCKFAIRLVKGNEPRLLRFFVKTSVGAMEFTIRSFHLETCCYFELEQLIVSRDVLVIPRYDVTRSFQLSAGARQRQWVDSWVDKSYHSTRH
jgi:hypothetical protein